MWKCTSTKSFGLDTRPHLRDPAAPDGDVLALAAVRQRGVSDEEIELRHQR